MYHASCRKSFIRNLSAWRSSNPLMIDNQNKMKEVYRAAFSSIQEVIDRDIVLGVSSVKWGLLARNEVGLFQIFNHVKTIKNH